MDNIKSCQESRIVLTDSYELISRTFFEFSSIPCDLSPYSRLAATDTLAKVAVARGQNKYGSFVY